MVNTKKKKPSMSDAKTKKRKKDPKSKSNDVSNATTSNERNAKKSERLKVNDTDSKNNLKKQSADRTQEKKAVKSDAKRNNKKSSNISRTSMSFEGNNNTPKASKINGIDKLPSSSLKTPSTSTLRSSLSTFSKEETPCSFYKVTKDENGKPVFSKSLLKYFLTVDSPEMDDLKNKRWNTSFLRETPKPNREIKIFTEEENNDPKYFENMPHIDSNLPDIPGSLHADIFKSMPINDSDEELQKIFKDITPVKGPNGKRKRKSTRISCYNGKPLPDSSLLFDYSGLLDSDICFEDNSTDSKENIIDIKVEDSTDC